MRGWAAAGHPDAAAADRPRHPEKSAGARMTPPAADISRRGQLHFTTEGLVWLGAAVLLGALAWRQSLNLLLVVAYAMIVLLAINAVLARSPALRIRAVRQPLPPVFADETVRPAIAVENASGKLATATIQDESRHWYVEGLAPRGSAECVESRRFPRRGRFTAPLIVASGFPFGLLRFERTEPAAGERVVLPALGQIDGEGLRASMHRPAAKGTRGKCCGGPPPIWPTSAGCVPIAPATASGPFTGGRRPAAAN